MTELTWEYVRQEEAKKEYFLNLVRFVKSQRESYNILPEKENMMLAYKLTEINDVKIVILGQDPYPNAKDAMGLAFSSMASATPASLKNVFKEIQSDLYPDEPIESLFKTNDLTSWAKQGVLLINSCLTVREGESGSHIGHGWEQFTGRMLEILSKQRKGIVYMLWGEKAKQFTEHIEEEGNLILTAAHPSPFSAEKGFFGCKHFSQALKFLRDDYWKDVHRAYMQIFSNHPSEVNTLKMAYARAGAEFEDFPYFLTIAFREFVTLPGVLKPEIEKRYTINFKLQ